MKNANWSIYKEQLIKSTGPTLPHSSLEDNLTYLINNILKAAKLCTAHLKPLRNQIPLPYWNEACRTAIRYRNKARNKWKSNKTEENRRAYQTEKTATQQALRTAQRTHWQDFCSKLDSQSTTKELWDTVKSLNGSPTSAKSSPSISSKTGIPLTDGEKADIFAAYFADSSSNNNFSPTFNQAKSQTPPINIPVNFNNNDPLADPITISEVRSALKGAGNSAPGSDDISYEMLRQLPEPALQALTEIINQSWLTSTLPQQWKTATVIPIHKKGKPPDQTSSFRPISLTSTICKLIERILASRLTWFLEHNNLYNSAQSGFRRDRGCGEQVARLANEAALATGNFATLAVFLDIEKAFDMVWRHGIIIKLHRLNVPARLTKWTQHFLEDRFLRVKISSSLSKPYLLENGTPKVAC